MQRRAPPGSGALWRGSRGALGGTEEPCARWGDRRGGTKRPFESERREVFNLADFARAAQKAQENLERAQAEADAWREIMTSAVKAKREGDFSKDLKDKDVKAVIEAATTREA